jgi:hypothetical protein
MSGSGSGWLYGIPTEAISRIFDISRFASGNDNASPDATCTTMDSNTH